MKNRIIAAMMFTILFSFSEILAAVDESSTDSKLILSECGCDLKDSLNRADWRKAADSAEKIIKAAPESSEAKEAYLWLGLYQKSQHNFPKSTEQYQKAARLFPNSWTSAEANARTGCNHFKLNDFERALKYFRKSASESQTWQQKKYASAWAKWVHYALAGQKEQLASNCATKSIAYYLGAQNVKFDQAKLETSLTVKDGLIPLLDIIAGLEDQNVKLKAVKCSVEKIDGLQLPIVAVVKPSHMIVIKEIKRDDKKKIAKINVYDPVLGDISYYKDELSAIWEEKVVTQSAPWMWTTFASVSKKDLGNVRLGTCYCCPEQPINDCDEDSDECCNRAGGGPGGGPGNGPGCGLLCRTSEFGFPHISVDTSTLALMVKDTPIGYTTPLGEDVKISLNFNSDLSYSGLFGNGWHSNLETRIRENPDNSVTVTRSGGHDATYTYAGGDYYAPVGVSSQLLRNADGTFALVFTKSHKIYHYDAHANGGKLLAREDRSGNILSYQYDVNGFLSSITDAVGRVTSFVTDASGRITNVTDPLGRQAGFVYDTNGNLVEVEDMAGNVFTYTYDVNNNISSLTEPKGTYTIQYGQWSYEIWVSSITDPLGNTYSYDVVRPMDWPSYVRDPRGNYTYYYPDWRTSWPWYGDTAKMEDALGSQVVYTYDNNRNKIQVQDKRGNSTYYTYDANGNQTSKIDSLGNRWLYTHDVNNNLVRSVDPKGRTAVYEYDYNGNVQSIIEKEDPNAVSVLSVISYTYNPNGLLSSTTVNGSTTTYDYDTYGNRIQVTDPEGNATTFTYDVIGRKTSTTNAEGATTVYAYDNLNRIIRVTHPDTTYVEYTYDCCGLSQVRDENGNLTSYEYDSLGRRTKVIDPEGNETSYVYDAVGNLTALTDAKGNTTSYTYDALNRVTRITYPLGDTESYTYDEEGNLTQKTDGKGHRTQYTYDKNNRLTQKRY